MYTCIRGNSFAPVSTILPKLEYACDILVEHNVQVEILFPLKQCGNICLLGVHIAS
jgi:hypothetical protein